MNQREVTILGQSYILGCPEGGEALLSAAVASVDREMSAIRDAGKVKARERIAVLAALNLAYQLADRPQRSAPTSTGATNTTPSTTANAPGSADVDALIRRLDAALGDDGQLL
jgi:cell division protein ZapA